MVHRFSGCGMQAQKLGAQAAECRALAVAANGLSGCGTQAPDQGDKLGTEWRERKESR